MSAIVKSVPTYKDLSSAPCFLKSNEQPDSPLEHSVTFATPNGKAQLFFALQSAAKPRATFTIGKKVQGTNVEFVASTAANKESSVTFKPQPFAFLEGNVSTSLKVSTQEKDFKDSKGKYGGYDTLGFTFKRANFTATGGVTTDLDSQHHISGSAVVGFEGFNLGGDAKLIKSSLASKWVPKSYNAGLSYKNGRYGFQATTDSKFEKIVASVTAAELGANKNYKVGVQAKVDVQAPKVGAPQRELVLGVAQKVSANTKWSVRYTANSGAIESKVSHSFPSQHGLSVSIATVGQLPSSAFAATVTNKFAIGLEFNDL